MYAITTHKIMQFIKKIESIIKKKISNHILSANDVNQLSASNAKNKKKNDAPYNNVALYQLIERLKRSLI